MQLVLLKKDVSREVAGADKLWPFRIGSHDHDYHSEICDVMETLTFCSWALSPVWRIPYGNAEVSKI